jgi:hypothetical protein
MEDKPLNFIDTELKKLINRRVTATFEQSYDHVPFTITGTLIMENDRFIVTTHDADCSFTHTNVKGIITISDSAVDSTITEAEIRLVPNLPVQVSDAFDLWDTSCARYKPTRHKQPGQNPDLPEET